MYDMCSALNLMKSKLEGLSDLASKVEHAKAVARTDAHRIFHSTERKYYDAASDRAAACPEEITCLTIDDPTKHQFDVPMQVCSVQACSRRAWMERLSTEPVHV
jgi:hypothetical protein